MRVIWSFSARIIIEYSGFYSTAGIAYVFTAKMGMNLKVPYCPDSIGNIFIVKIFKNRQIEAYFKPWRIDFPDKIIRIFPSTDQGCVVLKSHYNTILLSHLCCFPETILDKIIAVKTGSKRVLSLESIEFCTPCKVIGSNTFMDRNTRPCRK